MKGKVKTGALALALLGMVASNASCSPSAPSASPVPGHHREI